MAAVAGHLCTLGISIFPYIDDWLIVSPSRSRALKDIQITLSLLAALGLKINQEQSILTPTQWIVYIGAVLDSYQGKSLSSSRKGNQISHIHQSIPSSLLCHSAFGSASSRPYGLHHVDHLTRQAKDVLSTVMVSVPI